MNTLEKILSKAADLIATPWTEGKDEEKVIIRPNSWTQGSSSRTREGNTVAPWNPAAACFCAYGAIFRAFLDNGGTHEAWPVVRAELLKKLGFKDLYNLAQFNDNQTNVESVIAFLKSK